MNDYCGELEQKESSTKRITIDSTSRSDGQWINAKCNITEEILDKFNAIGLINPISIEHLKKNDVIFTAAQTKELIFGKENKLDLDTEIKITKRNIKSCRNPLEKLQLERKLNNLYKEKKKWERTQKSTN